MSWVLCIHFALGVWLSAARAVEAARPISCAEAVRSGTKGDTVLGGGGMNAEGVVGGRAVWEGVTNTSTLAWVAVMLYVVWW